MTRFLLLLILLSCPTALHAATILGIDSNGDVHSISTLDGSFTTVGATGLSSAHTLARSPGGSLYTFSGVGDNEVHLIDESDFSVSTVARGNTITGGEGGLAFVSETMAYATTRAPGPFPFLLALDLTSGTLVGSQVLSVQNDISALTLRNDGMLVGIGRESNDLLAINPVNASISVIANLSGLTVLNTGGLAQIDGVAYFATSLAGAGADTEIWTIDLYTGAHSLEATVTGLAGITGIAAIPEPGTALLLGLGLTLLTRQRQKTVLATLILAGPFGLAVLPASAGELDDILGEFCKSGFLDGDVCQELFACLEDPASCAGPSAANPSAFSAASSSGGGMAVTMVPVAGASIDFRVDNSENPRLSPSAARIAFDELNGPQRTHRAVFGDGVPGGTQAPSPNSFGAHSTILGGIDDGGLIVGTRSQSFPSTDSEAYIADASFGIILPEVNSFGTLFQFTGAFDSNFNSNRIVGNAFDSGFGTFGKNFPALWVDNGSTVTLRIFNGLSVSPNRIVGEFRAITPAGTFAVGAQGSGNTTPTSDVAGTQAFLATIPGGAFTALPFLASATANKSAANALSDATDIIVGTATNSAGNSVATAWFDVGGTYFEQELPKFGTATSSQGLAVAGDGLSLGGSVGDEAAVWNGITFEVRQLANYVEGLGLTILPECTLNNVSDMDLAGVRLVGEATCDRGSGPFTRVYELETPVPLPEPGIGIGLASTIPIVFQMSRAKRARRRYCL